MLFPLHRSSSCRGTLPRRVRDGDPVRRSHQVLLDGGGESEDHYRLFVCLGYERSLQGRRLAGRGSVALGGSAALVQYSPARRTYFVRDDRVAGTRPDVIYDAQSRLIESKEPDAGTGRSFYDPAGRLRATQTQRQIDSGTATVTVYDGLDRAVATGEWRHGMTETQLRNYFKDMTHRFDPALSALDSATLTRNFYDRMPGRDSVLTALGVQLYPAGLTADSFRYTKTRLVATVSRFRDADGTLKGHSVAYRHDKKGRVIASYVYNGGVAADSLKLLATETEYDLAGKVLRVTKYPYGLSAAGKARSIAERYTYDRLGRVDTLYVKDGAGSETVLAAYEYYPTGSVKRIALGGGTLSLDYTYHISGAVKSAAATRTDDGATLYSETLYYEDCGGAGCTPQYNGNVSRMAHTLAHGNTGYGQERDVSYAYDLMNRLTKVDDADMDGFDETFAYDPQGRITAQRRGADAANAAGGEYSYYAQSDRLEKVSAGMGGTADSRGMGADSNFVYDADGNMTYDASKKMTVSYDYRGLPTEFVREVPSSSGVAGAADSVRLVMTYDGSGSRIGKRYERRNAGDAAWSLQLATHYTGLGSEIRENGLDGSAKVVVSLPQGLGRYSPSSASENVASSVPSFEWYLKNHLGSTMLVYGTSGNEGSLKAAYDYRAFGEQVDLTMPTDKVTETFTGKERDDETGLNNHGARMLDPMIGTWIAVDLKRFFPSPYLYMGNGYNPIRYAELNGERPGYTFNLPIEAGQDFARVYNYDAIRNNLEYSSAIYSYKNDDKVIYSYNIPIRGGVASARFDNQIDLTKGQTFETTVHAHGAYLDEYGLGNDLPSVKDYELNFNLFGSKSPAFVSGPSGYLIQYGKDQSMDYVATSGIAADASSPIANPSGIDPFANPVDDVYR